METGLVAHMASVTKHTRLKDHYIQSKGLILHCVF